MYDVIVIGAGPAGLQAALTLGRMHRSVLLLDSGEYRNGAVAHMHNMIGEDGTAPAELRARARVELGAYADVEIRDVAAVAISGAEGAFAVELADGASANGRRVILATGIADDLPDVPGLDRLWGTRAFSCPFCDGHEHAGKPIAIIGEAAKAVHLIGLLGRIVESVTVFPVGAPFSSEDTRMLKSLGAAVSASPVESVSADGSEVVVAAGSGSARFAGAFVASVSVRQRAPFAEQLGLRMLPTGAIEIDEFGATSTPGISAAGDLAHRAAVPGMMAAVVQAAAAGQLAAIGAIRALG